ncbi:hypothetical protein C1J00_07420 [Streptomyces cahuitamycinicus]|uniref:Uncharacterized protein n=1 Tax=Streptomyces cahuitamycinicus TaxID=2070367 RepID=A0A2N8TUT8_9ACTN|nr:hypothetical protein C1J00_07420 [Streptomyces cahuitamycinicus]
MTTADCPAHIRAGLSRERRHPCERSASRQYGLRRSLPEAGARAHLLQTKRGFPGAAAQRPVCTRCWNKFTDDRWQSLWQPSWRSEGGDL